VCVYVSSSSFFSLFLSLSPLHFTSLHLIFDYVDASSLVSSLLSLSLLIFNRVESVFSCFLPWLGFPTGFNSEDSSENRGRCLDKFCVSPWQYGVALRCVALWYVMFRCGEILKRSVETVAMYNIELTGRLFLFVSCNLYPYLANIEIIRLIQWCLLSNIRAIWFLFDCINKTKMLQRNVVGMY